uniref:Uncharacterized protein n=1 Tax=Theileria annulata TaxID=5874 RepID=A0A3B0MLL4_THEAN
MRENPSPNYSYMSSQSPQNQAQSQRFPQLVRQLPTQNQSEGISSGFQTPEIKSQQSFDHIPNLKREYGSQSSNFSTIPEPSEFKNQFNDRPVKINSDHVDSILDQNFSILTTINDSDSLDDSEVMSLVLNYSYFLVNITRLHQNLIFLARISDQQN